MQEITFQLGTRTVEATRENGHNHITRVTGRNGQTAPITLDDLEQMEDVIEAGRFRVLRTYEVTETEALDHYLGTTRRFLVEHDGDTIHAVRTAEGYAVHPASEQFTEVVEAFHIDRYWQMLEESDVQGHARRCYA